MKSLDWYFDYISPFAYLQSRVLDRFAEGTAIRRRPLLFAGLLSHWGQLGPAEIAPKRDWTYRHCTWLAAHHGIPFRMPAAHPFDSLPLLRLSIALGDRADVVDRLFRFVWVDGHVPGDRSAWQALLDELGVDDAATRTAEVKDALRANGELARAAGVFGVPTAVVDGRVFWGFDATPMLADYLAGAPIFAGGALDAAARVPVGAVRPQAARTTA